MFLVEKTNHFQAVSDRMVTRPSIAVFAISVLVHARRGLRYLGDEGEARNILEARMWEIFDSLTGAELTAACGIINSDNLRINADVDAV